MRISPADMLSLQGRLAQLNGDVGDVLREKMSGKLRVLDQRMTEVHGAFAHLNEMHLGVSPKWDLMAPTKRHENQPEEHEMEYMLSQGLSGLLKAVVNPQTPLTKEERKTIIGDIKSLVEKCDDVGIFVSQGANKEGLTTNPLDIGAYSQKQRKENLMKGKTPDVDGNVEIKPEEMAEFRRLSEGFEPSNRGLFLRIQKELAKLDRGASRD